MCGEKPSVIKGAGLNGGSPPRVRGEDRFHRHLVKVGRITPACAGRSEYDAFRKTGKQDHPRVCGEKLVVLPT